jgi:serine phosphatase RsbU (regulator of sigma subunit)
MGGYTRGPLYLCAYIYFIVAVFLSVWTFIRKREDLDRNQVLALIVFLGGPIVVAVLPDPADGLSIMCGVIMSTLIMTYCLVSIEQSKEQMAREKELLAATSIQYNMLPHTFPAFPERDEFDIYASMTPAKEVGGDFYDMFLTDEKNLAMVIADVSGKGITAALFMAQAKQVIQSQMLLCGGDPVAALTEANLQLIKNSISDMFVTVWLGVVNLSTGHLTFVDAGHEYPALQKAGGAFAIEKDNHSMVVAGLKRAKYKVNEMDLAPGDTIFLYTDGVTEARNFDREMYGEQRLVEALNEAVNLSLEEIDRHVRKSIATFVSDAEQYDDITMLCFRYIGGR